MKIEKINPPFMMRPEVIGAIQNMGKNGYDYQETKKGLVEATKKMLEYFEDLEKDLIKDK